MICPRCGAEISDTETICPECLQEINRNMEFNDFREDGYVQIQKINEGDTSEPINYTPKYFNISEMRMLIIAIVFILFIAVFTVFAYRYIRKTTIVYVDPYEVTADVTLSTTAPEPTTEPPTENTVKNVTVKSLYGSWRETTEAVPEGQAVAYYSFADGGYAQENFGSITSTGKYRDLSDGDVHEIYLSVNSGVKGTFEFDVFGNDRDGISLTLTNTSTGKVYTFIKTDAIAYNLKTIENFKVDKNLVGYWVTKDKKKSYELTSSGKLIRYTNGTTTNCVYTIDKKNIITLKYMKEVVKTLDLEYKVSSDKKRVKINNVVYYKTKK